MSLISKDDNSVSNSNYLILDLGLYPASKELMDFFKNIKKNQILELNPNQMEQTDWDHVLDLIIKNKKCITL